MIHYNLSLILFQTVQVNAIKKFFVFLLFCFRIIITTCTCFKTFTFNLIFFCFFFYIFEYFLIFSLSFFLWRYISTISIIPSLADRSNLVLNTKLLFQGLFPIIPHVFFFLSNIFT